MPMTSAPREASGSEKLPRPQNRSSDPLARPRIENRTARLHHHAVHGVVHLREVGRPEVHLHAELRAARSTAAAPRAGAAARPFPAPSRCSQIWTPRSSAKALRMRLVRGGQRLEVAQHEDRDLLAHRDLDLRHARARWTARRSRSRSGSISAATWRGSTSQLRMSAT